MKFAIIAAGEGSRLSQEGISIPKPLVPLNGVPMIERLTRIFLKNGADSVVIIINNENETTKKYLIDLQKQLPLELIVKTTPSSMHSLYELSPYLGDDKFCVTTVDTIFREEEFSGFIKAFQNTEEDGYMAVTDFIDDEKPLYIATGENNLITGFYDDKKSDIQYISGGIYCLRQSALNVLKKCLDKGLERMRNFQRELVKEGLSLQAYPFSKILDVDHAEDIKKAESFLTNNN